MAVLNCGLSALQGITKLKSVSMYTLLQLAKDNDVHLYFCKVDPDKLPLVKRPAILHSDDHFTLIEDEKAIPPGKYTGWVLSSKPMGLPLPHSLAKQITGGKKGGFLRTVLPTIIGFASNLILPGSGLITGALANIGMDQYAKSNHPEQLGKPGRPLDILGAGLAGAASGAASQGAISGWNAAGAAGPASLGAKLSGAFGGAVTGLSHPIASNPLFGSNPSSLFPGSLGSQVAGFNNGTSSALSSNANSAARLASSGLPQGGTGGTGALGGFTIKGTLPNGTNTPLGYQGPESSSAANNRIMAQNSSINVPNVMSGGANAGNIASGVGGATGGAAKGGLESIFGGLAAGPLLKTGIGLISSQMNPPPEYNSDTIANYDKARQYLGETTLPPVTSQQLNKYLKMSIPEIKTELMNPSASNRALLEIDKKYQDSLAQVQRAAANSGQDINTSSDARKAYDEVNRQWAEARANLQAQLEQTATQQAVGIQQWALEQSIKQNNFDYNAAMELANQFGVQDQLQYAIQSKNYDQFQSLIAQLLDPSLGQQKSNTININLPNNLGTALA